LPLLLEVVLPRGRWSSVVGVGVVRARCYGLWVVVGLSELYPTVVSGKCR
jgi:hypothetical protein